MTTNKTELNQAVKRMESLRETGYVVSVRYNMRSSSFDITLNTKIKISFPASLVEGLAGASTESLRDVETTPSGLGLHWPSLDIDLYVPALLQGNFGTKNWMAKQLGAVGGQRKSAAKTASSRANGRKGGRPKTKTDLSKNKILKKLA